MLFRRFVIAFFKTTFSLLISLFNFLKATGFFFPGSLFSLSFGHQILGGGFFGKIVFRFLLKTAFIFFAKLGLKNEPTSGQYGPPPKNPNQSKRTDTEDDPIKHDIKLKTVAIILQISFREKQSLFYYFLK